MNIKQASDLHFTYVRNTPELRDAFINKCKEFGIGVFGLGGENYLEVYSDGYDEFEICGTDDLEPQSKKLTMSDLTDIPTEKNRREEMTTYNTYQEAKIAMPKACICVYKNNGKDVFIGMPSREGTTLFNGAEFAEPQDYCMTVEKFLSDGFKLEIGDVIFGEDEYEVDVVSSDLHCRSFNMPVDADRNIYILRAAALEDIPTETPEEKEVLDSIESAGEVEWSGEGLPPVNIECEWIGGGVAHGDWGPVIVRAYSGDYAWIEKLYDNSMHTVRSPAFFRKPETPQQRKDRERACAIYDMCAEADIFNEESNFWAGKFYDLGYKKDKTHGTN